MLSEEDYDAFRAKLEAPVDPETTAKLKAFFEKTGLLIKPQTPASTTHQTHPDQPS
jgi:hypothetical protein